MKSAAFIKSNAWMHDIPGLEHGTHNGYVAVPPSNRYHGKRYDDVDASVHGGLTFSEPATYGDDTRRNQVLDGCEFITEGVEIGDDWWIFGFDTAHWGDNPYNCNRDYVIREALSLQEQLEKGDI